LKEVQILVASTRVIIGFFSVAYDLQLIVMPIYFY
jgi:hypothetical protein